MGELHLDIYAQRMQREYDCPVIMGRPKVAFRETLVEMCEFDYLHKRQSGGAGQYAHVIGRVEPLSAVANTQLVFIDKTVGPDVPKVFVPAIEKGFRQSCDKGPLTGSKISGICFRLLDGMHHIVDSNEYAFINATTGAMEQIFERGSWMVIEPVMKVEISAPSEFQGAVMAALQKRYGILQGSDSVAGWTSITAEVPLAQMFGYSSELRGSTQGKGEYSMEYSRYAPCIAETQNELMMEHRKELEVAAKNK